MVDVSLLLPQVEKRLLVRPRLWTVEKRFVFTLISRENSASLSGLSFISCDTQDLVTDIQGGLAEHGR